jgi:hypothetical protein
VTISVIILEP